MEAMVETRRYDEAEELYTDVVDYYLRECGIYPSSRLLEILEKYSNQMNHAHEILENIQEGMNEQEETERGGYFCSYPVFRGIYQASIRIMKRTSLFKNGKKYLVNYYTDSLSYTELYNWDNDSNDGLNPERRIFWNKQGQMVYEQCIYKDNVEYLFKNGEVIDNVEFLERFVKALNLCQHGKCSTKRANP